MRSGYICSLKSIRDIFPRKLLFLIWTFAEVYFWLIALTIFMLQVITRGGIDVDIVDVILYFCIITYLNYAYYLAYKPWRFIFAPFHSFLYGLTLIYTRIHAAVTIADDGWGTRKMERQPRKEETSTEGVKNQEMAVA